MKKTAIGGFTLSFGGAFRMLVRRMKALEAISGMQV